ncbi:MAG: hypothetical protein MPW15_13585 [Candidatus Manganitrophus sp.]|nr:hypothetical protein [Candidatus Manganitrophus sp.]
MPFSKQFIFLFLLIAFSSCGRKESDDGVGVRVVPTFFKIPSGGEVQLSADVAGTLNQEVTWEVTGPFGDQHFIGGAFPSAIECRRPDRHDPGR